MTKHSPEIELSALRIELRRIDENCTHWDYEDENPDCECAPRRDEIKARIRTLRARTER